MRFRRQPQPGGNSHPPRLPGYAERWSLGKARRTGQADFGQGCGPRTLADFDSHFGETEFNELGGQISVRLGTDNTVPVDRPFTLWLEITELVIPGHRSQGPAGQITVEEVHEDGVYLRCGDRVIAGRYGLEALS